jgi:hypothetical protein
MKPAAHIKRRSFNTMIRWNLLSSFWDEYAEGQNLFAQS